MGDFTLEYRFLDSCCHVNRVQLHSVTNNLEEMQIKLLKLMGVLVFRLTILGAFQREAHQESPQVLEILDDTF